MRQNRGWGGKGLLASALALCPWLAWAEYATNFQTPQSPIARQIYDLHMIILYICVAICVVVFGVLFYSLYAHRKSRGVKAAQFHESLTVEVIWTIIPFIILVLMAIPATKTILDMKDTSRPDMTIKVTGYQWKWHYEYINEEIGFFSTLKTTLAEIENRAQKQERYLLDVDNPLVVPVGKKVRVLLTANDVIHAWFVPALGVKQSTIPGFIRDTWFLAEKEGIYRGQCAELCGKDHAYMPIVVKVVSNTEYTAWVADQRKKLAAQQDDPNKVFAKEELITRGEKVYAANCAACHQANGKGGNGIPALDGSPVVRGPKAEQQTVLLKGRNGRMPAWAQLSNADLAAVMTYTRNSLGNSTGEVIQPKEFQEHRKTLGL